jgi:N-acetylglucosaminyl-diphospho-decaprenol L-rhamnosyltransferase
MTGHSWSLVTVTYNSAEILRRCWSGPKPYDWIVVDNNSTDDSVAVAQELGARVVRLPANVGFSTANNAGLRESAADYVLFANPDLEVEPDGLDRLQDHLDAHGGLVAPQLLSSTGEAQPNGRGFPYFTARLGNRKIWPWSRIHAGYRVIAAPGQALWVPWVTGAALAGRRETILSIGGWDERFFLYYEDIELCLRAWREGEGVALLGDVRWIHHWARANNTLRWSRAHSQELRSARTFFAMFPEFVAGLPRARRRHPRAAALIGRPVVAPAPTPPAQRPAGVTRAESEAAGRKSGDG